MKQKLFFLILISFQSIYGFIIGQNQDTTVKFIPSGKIEGRIFSDYYYQFNDYKTAFEVSRAYLGYSYNFTENFSARVTFDIGKPDITVNGKTVDTISTSLQNMAILKFAYGTYQKNKLSISFGMIELNQVKLQDQQWGRRYIMRVAADENGFWTSADLGFKVDYKFADWLTADVCIRNGEGFKKIQADNKYWYAAEITLHPVKNLFYKALFDYSKKVTDHYYISNYISYITNKFKLSGEFVYGKNYGDILAQKLYTYSVISSVAVHPKVEIFARYDKLFSNTLEGQANTWNYSNDKSFVIGGIQYSPVKNITMAANGRYTLPDNPSKTEKTAIYLNFDFKF